MPIRPSSPPSNAPRFIPVKEPVANLLARLANRWEPSAFILPPIVSLFTKGTDWTGELVTVRIVGRELHIRLRGANAAQQAGTFRTIEASANDGGKLTGHVFASNLQFGDAEEKHELLLRCNEWTYTPVTAPALWVASLQDVKELPGPGNLSITKPKNSDQVFTYPLHLILKRPGLTSYFIEAKEQQGSKTVWLCFDSKATDETRESVAKNLGLFRVLLAMPIRPSLFYGLADDGTTVGAQMIQNVEAAREVQVGIQSLVPLAYSQLYGTYAQTHGVGIWIAPFYSRLYNQFALNERTSFSFSRYSHTLDQFDTDSQFELVGGSVSMLIKELAARPDASKSVKSARIAAARRLRLLSLTARQSKESPQNELLLYPEVLQLRTERLLLTELLGDTGNLVADDLIKARQTFEYGVISEARDYEVNPELGLLNYKRLQRLRHTYAILLARAIDYQGPVNTFPVFLEDETTTSLAIPEINPVIVKEARTIYKIEADLSGLSVWPSFALPKVPDIPLVSQFLTFAEQLRQATEGKVVARLRPLPKEEQSPLQLSFRLMVNNQPSTQVALFTVEVVDEGLLIRGWKDKPLLINNEGLLAKFQESLLGSKDFRLQVERLLLIEQDIQLGEV